MKKLGEEVAYLRGLAEGLDIDDKSKEGKMIGKIVEILGCFADKVEELEYSVGDLEDQVEELEYEVEELQQEVEDLEEWLYDEDVVVIFYIYWWSLRFAKNSKFCS